MSSSLSVAQRVDSKWSVDGIAHCNAIDEGGKGKKVVQGKDGKDVYEQLFIN
jgi:hypothetical protein